MPKFTRKEISLACEEAEAYLRDNSVDTKEVIRMRLNMEETLLRYREKLGEDAEFRLEKGKRLGRVKFRISVPGPMTDPYASNEDPNDESKDVMRTVLVGMGALPSWTYSRGKNIVTFSLKKKKTREWLTLLISILAAVLCGILIRNLPDAAEVFVIDDVLSQLMDTFLAFLNAVAGPMIFLSIVWGIYSIGDISTFSVLGKKLVFRYLISLLALTVMVVLLSLPFFSWNIGASQEDGWFSPVFTMLLDIIPDNLITPFTTGNTLQILFEAVVVGIVMIILSEKVDVVATLVEQISRILNAMMSFVATLVPYFVFCSLTSIVARSDAGVMENTRGIITGTLAGCVFLLAAHTALTCIRVHCTPRDLWKNALSTFLIALTTASSAAAFSDNLETCTEKFHINRKLASFAVPLGQIMYKPALAIELYFAAASTAAAIGEPVSVSWFVIAVVLSTLLSCATPPIPGGAAASFSIVLLQLGLPLDTLPIILAVNVFLDYFITSTDVFADQCILYNAAGSFGLIEKVPETEKN